MNKAAQALLNDPEIKPLFFDARKVTQADGSEQTVQTRRTYLRFNQREEKEREARELSSVLEDPLAVKKLINPGKIRQRLMAQRRDIVTQTPPALTASQRDKVASLEKALFEQWTENMPSDEAQRRKPPGARDHHDAWNAKNKLAILHWKTARMVLNPDSRESDLCNIERYRPSRPGANLNLDAQINGVFAQTPASRENFDAVFERDWRSKETQAEFIARMKAQGVEVSFKARPLRTQKDGGKVYEAKDGKMFSGPMAKARHTRYQNLLDRKARAEGALA